MASPATLATRRHRPRTATIALVAGLALATSGCAGGQVRPEPLDVSIGTAFANLYRLQQAQQGDPVPSLRSLQAGADCQKGTPGTEQRGAGDDWVCAIRFFVAGPATPVTALYNVNVQTNGCYAADGDGPAAVNGARTITAADGSRRPNPLWLIDGCFELS